MCMHEYTYIYVCITSLLFHSMLNSRKVLYFDVSDIHLRVNFGLILQFTHMGIRLRYNLPSSVFIARRVVFLIRRGR